jgi:hypothetical protein
MADQKLSELTFATGAVSSDLLYVVQGNTSKKISVSSLTRSLSTAFTTVLVLPVYTTSTVAVAVTGSTIINTTLNAFQWYNGTSWVTIT